ncbi:MAG: hypothetical protein V2A79_14580 [Planctomycetota bacterium]
MIKETLLAGDVTGTPETTTDPIPVGSPDQLGTPSLLAPLMPSFKRWYEIADGHFGLLYHPGDRFDEATNVQVEFLRSQLDA